MKVSETDGRNEMDMETAEEQLRAKSTANLPARMLRRSSSGNSVNPLLKRNFCARSE